MLTTFAKIWSRGWRGVVEPPAPKSDEVCIEITRQLVVESRPCSSDGCLVARVYLEALQHGWGVAVGLRGVRFYRGTEQAGFIALPKHLVELRERFDFFGKLVGYPAQVIIARSAFPKGSLK